MAAKDELIINRELSGGYCKTAVSRWPSHNKNKMEKSVEKSGLDKRGSCHVFRRSNATWKIESGWSLKHIAASLNNTEKTVSKYYALVRPDYIKTLPKPSL